MADDEPKGKDAKSAALEKSAAAARAAAKNAPRAPIPSEPPDAPPDAPPVALLKTEAKTEAPKEAEKAAMAAKEAARTNPVLRCKGLKQRYPSQDAVETVLDWVEELGRTRVLGSRETNALGMPEFDDTYVFVLECLLLGLSATEINERATAQYPPEAAAELMTRVPELTESLKKSTLFKSLLTD